MRLRPTLPEADHADVGRYHRFTFTQGVPLYGTLFFVRMFLPGAHTFLAPASCTFSKPRRIGGTTLRRATKLMLGKGGMIMYTALTIAGSDSSGGAGIQADLKTMAAHHVYGMSAITALTAQNTTGVKDIMEVTPEFLKEQLDSVFTDIRPDAVKTGMVSSSGLIRVIAQSLTEYKVEKLVVDTVMASTSGSRLISEEAISTLKEELIPLATVITPNIPEAEVLTGMTIGDARDMEKAAKQIYETFGCAVLLKGGHRVNDANDLLCSDKGLQWFEGRRIDNPNTHGTGCTLSSAIASNLAKGADLVNAVKAAKDYISMALDAQLDLGAGRGPMDHMFAVNGVYTDGKGGAA